MAVRRQASASAASRSAASPSPTSWTSSTTRHTWRGVRRHDRVDQGIGQGGDVGLAVSGASRSAGADVGPEGWRSRRPGATGRRHPAAPQPAVVATRGEGVLVHRLGEQRRLAEPRPGDDDRDGASQRRWTRLSRSLRLTSGRPGREAERGGRAATRHDTTARAGRRAGWIGPPRPAVRRRPFRANAPLAPCWCPVGGHAVPLRGGVVQRSGPSGGGMPASGGGCRRRQVLGPGSPTSWFPAVGSGVRLPRRTPARHVRPSRPQVACLVGRRDLPHGGSGAAQRSQRDRVLDRRRRELVELEVPGVHRLGQLAGEGRAVRARPRRRRR